MTSSSYKNYVGDFGYQYNCGANCTVAINDMYLAEVVGISYNVMDSATPIYGYSSRLFDAVAPGQKLVQGSFVINYVQPNYIFHKARKGANAELAALGHRVVKAQAERMQSESESVLKPKELEAAQKKKKAQIKKGLSQIAEKRGKGAEIIASNQDNFRSLEAHYWGKAGGGEKPLLAKDSTLIGPSRIEIMFGGNTRHKADHMIEIHGVYIIGHGSAIQIDENVILEEYNFIGRDLIQLTYR
ncbi:MAG: hypothetical protein CMB80_03345 [Flammeovirgaceae bacterium]|nr:hypothetical protein [Flammeovirgaceae bacterium]